MKTADHRIARGTVIRDTTIHFTFDGKRYAGREGDTLASALLANGVHLVGRSFKYHRPRGVLGAGADEPNALVGIRRDRARYAPNLLATQVELYDGLDAVSQNRHPSLENDRMAVNDKLLSRFIPAGFYYKTFMWPKKAWDRLYEPRIREAAGLGVAPSDPDPDHYTQRYAHCDVLVIGGGPAGIVAAREAAETGARVILCDDRARLGGSLLAAVDTDIAGQPAADLAGRRAGGARRAAQRDVAAPHDRLRLLSAQLDRPDRKADRSPRVASAGPAARAVVAGARGAGGARDRRDRAPAGVPRQ
jgi:sarcosine oxidase, subunit alpha